MTLPTSWQTVRVFGTYKRFDTGEAAHGAVTFEPVLVTAPEGAGRTVVLPKPRTVTLDVAGKIDIQLPATDDPDIAPTGWAYRVTEKIGRSEARAYFIHVPLAGGDIDLATAPQVVPPENLVSYLGLPAVQAAQASAAAASASAAAAATSEGNAAASATSATTSATTATTQAASATASATAAGTSATSAVNSATAAATSETNAAASAGAAAASASAANTSATNAGASATAAASSATAAANSASVASAAAASGPVFGFDTKANMDADLAHAAGSLALVTNDSTPANNGTYRKTGASGSGSWVLSEDRVTGVEGRTSRLEKDVRLFYGTADASVAGGFIDRSLSGVVTTSPGYKCTPFLRIMPSTSYTVTGYTVGNAAHAWYDANQVFISAFAIGTSATPQTVTSPSNAYYMRCTTQTAGTLDVRSTDEDFDIRRLRDVLSAHMPNVDASLVLRSGTALTTVLSTIETNQANIFAAVNNNANSIDQITDQTAPFFVDPWAYTAGGVAVVTTTTAIDSVVSRDSDYQLTLATGAGAHYTSGGMGAAIEDSATGRVYGYPVKTRSGDVLTFYRALPATPINVQPMHDSVNGQHLTRLGYKGLADLIVAQGQKYAYKKADVLFEWHPPICSTPAFNNVDVYDLTNTTKLVDMTALSGAIGGGLVSGTTNLVKLCQQESANESIGVDLSTQHYARGYKIQDNGIGKGVEFSSTVNKRDGFIQIPIAGRSLSYVSSVDALTYNTDGKYRVEVIGDTATVLHDVTYDSGFLQTIFVDFTGVTTIKVRVTCAEAKPTAIKWYGCYAYGKSPSTPTTGLFKNGDVVAFLGDSWTQSPIAAGAESPLPRADGSTSDGMCYLSERLRTRLAALGVTVTTKNMGKGGTTSAWGLYWVSSIIALYPKPTHCVINFGINDHNSNIYSAGVDTPYDFDPANQWAFKTLSTGGVAGRCTYDQWFANMKAICERLIAAGIKPVVIMPAWTASNAQAASIRDKELARIGAGFRDTYTNGGGT